jgi:hypothetical protein
MRRALPIALAAVFAATAGAAVPTPGSVLGFEVAQDRKLADWNQSVAYFRALAAASPCVRVEELGPTTEGRPFLLVTITSEANMARLDEIRGANLRLADPRGLGDVEAERLVAEGKTIVVLNHGIHPTEVGPSQAAIATAYWLAGDSLAAREILEATVVLMVPSQNPDGMQKVVDWYRRTLGTPFEGARPPFLTHTYAGHDNNRDWYMFTQAETRLTVARVYDRWRPQIVHDLHQMGPRGARLFVPPYLDPYDPSVDPALVAAGSALGAHVAARLTAEGKAGVVTHAIFDAWSPSRAYPHTHGGVRILSECASARLATPVEVSGDELEAGIGYDPRRSSWNFPLPWPGGTWRLRDVVDYEVAATRALLEHAARNRSYWLRTFLGVNRRASERAVPYAFLVPSEQRDPLAAARLLSVLRTGGVEVRRARAPFEALGQSFPAGTHVVLMAQPASAFAKTVLERQSYPDLRRSPSDAPQKPYDTTAHTLPLLMGVDVRAAGVFTADLVIAEDTPVAPGRVEGKGRFLALGHATGDMVALGRLLRRGVSVRWATEAFGDRGRRFEAGSLLVPATARDALEPMARELGVVARGVDTAPPALVVRRPRLGLYQSWRPAADEGWTRFVFERDLGVDYETLHDADVRRGGLARRFDVVLLPDQAAKEIVEGNAPGSLPDEYTGGLGEEGVASLKAFVEAGGTLVTLNGASRLPIEDFGLGVSDALPKRPSQSAAQDPDAVYAPGAILRVTIDPREPLAHGLGSAAAIWFEESPAFEAKRGTVVARYADDSPLLSGWLLDGERLAGKAALVVAPLGTGRVVLFGFRPQYRAQSWGTYVALLNAIYLSAATPPR